MNKLTTCFLLLATLSITGVYADSVITLKDGSQIKGEVTGLTNGVYTIKMPIVGDVHVATADVITIANGGAAASSAQPTAQQNPHATDNNLKQQVQAAQAQLLSNPQVVLDLQQMVQDPEIAELLTDPELVRIVTSNDVNAVANNPKAKALMNNPKLHALIEKLRGTPAQ